MAAFVGLRSLMCCLCVVLLFLTSAVCGESRQPSAGACSYVPCTKCSGCACVRVGNFIAKPQGSTVNVTLVSSNGSVTVCPTIPRQSNFSEFARVNLTSPNGPESYWTIQVLCQKAQANLTLKESLFLNSSDPSMTKYSLSLYGNCTSNKPPGLWFNVSSTAFHPPTLGMDEALFILRNKYSLPLEYSKNSGNCYKCADHPLGTIYPGEEVYVVVDSTFSASIKFRHKIDVNHTEVVCSKRISPDEHSSHLITVLDTGCEIQVLSMGYGAATYLPILYASVAIVAMVVTWVLLSVGYRCMRDRGYLHYNKIDRITARDLGSPKTLNRGRRYSASGRSEEREPLMRDSHSSLNASSLITRGTADVGNGGGTVRQGGGIVDEKPKKYRLRSLDTFRGLSLTIMIFVNYGGGGYWFFNHSRWNGLTVADLVFPWFVWIMGVSIVFSFKGRKKDVFWLRLYQVFRRSIILFGLGLFLNNGFRLTHWRIPGVLQRFGITYFVVALTELFTVELYSKYKFTFWKPLRDLTNNWAQWMLVFALEALWLCITFLLPVHNCPTGYLGPGGLANHGAYMNQTCTGGAAGAIDRWLFKEDHIFQYPTCKQLYDTGSYDPEGALGALNSIVICFLGVQAGRILTHFPRSHANILVRLLIWGVALGVLGTALCEGQKNEGVIPLNKNLWSLSFILVMAGTGYLLLAAFYFLIDVIHWWNGSPFRYPGMNSIIVYVGSEILQEYFPFSWYSHNTSHLDLLASNIVGVSLWLIISYYWYHINFFVKI